MHGSTRRIAMVFAALGALFLAQSASADTAGEKALRGLGNIITCPMALPGEIYRNWKEGGPSQGLTQGLALGIAMMPARTGSGRASQLSTMSAKSGDFSLKSAK